jgi:hypothetical protein
MSSSAGGITHAQARIDVTPWQAELRVTLLLLGHGQYIEVMEVEGASLLRREQVGAFLRLSFRLDDGACTTAQRLHRAHMTRHSSLALRTWARLTQSCAVYDPVPFPASPLPHSPRL